jgi:Ca-activated chloride channel homolog
MTFARPALLLLLAIPVMLGFWHWHRHGVPLALPFDYGRQSRGTVLRRLLNVAALPGPLLLAVAICLWAGPQQPGIPEQERELTNIQFVLDVSGSMRSAFGSATRYDAAMAAIQAFTRNRPGDAFGLTVFGNEVLHWVPLTRDVSAIQLATPFLRPERLPSWFGGTQIAKAVRAAGELLVQRQEGDRLIILVSDGRSSDLGGGADAVLAADLRRAGVVLYAVHVADSAPPTELVSLAEYTGGEVFAADAPWALDDVFRHIDRMQKVRIRHSVNTVDDCFSPFAAAGLGLLAIQVLVLFGLRYTPW